MDCILEEQLKSMAHFEHKILSYLEAELGLVKQIDVWNGLLWGWCSHRDHFSTYATRFFFNLAF